ALLDEHLPHVALQRGDELVGTAAAARLALAALLRGGTGAVGRTRGDDRAADRRRPDHLDVEATAGDLDDVALLDSLLLVVARRLGSGERQLLQPRLVLDEVAAGLRVAPLLGREQGLVERDEGLELLDLVLGQRAQHAARGVLAVLVP